MSLCDEGTGVSLIRTYSRTVGAIQLLYASFFAWVAFPRLRWSFDQMSWVAQHGFGFEGMTFKGVYLPAFDVSNFVEGMVLALLSLACFIGGYGLLRLRPWTRRWGIAYLTVVLIFSLWDLATVVIRGHDLGQSVRFSMAFILPYLPLLLISPPPHKPPSFGRRMEPSRL
jgi:hypothetical protein